MLRRHSRAQSSWSNPVARIVTRRARVVAAIVLIVGGVGSAASLATAGPAAAPTTVFVLAGQSNMQGRGQPLTDGEPSDPRLLGWRELANGGWRVAKDPLASPSDAENGIGPGMSFGLAVAHANPAVTVGLIQCAKGGKSIAEWQPVGKIYQACMSKVNESKSVVAGVLFLQGETDAMKKNAAAGWAAAFAKVAAAFRNDLKARVLLGQIGRIDAAKFPYQQTVRDQQAAAAKKLGAPLIKTLDLAVSGDGVHFTVASYKIIGARFASAWAAP